MIEMKTQADEELLEEIRRPDLSILGNSVRNLPPMQWQERMFFAAVSDIDLKEWTGGFPATFRKDKITHPVFVLRCYASGHQVCPCSSRGKKRLRYIRKGCRLEMKGGSMDRDSFLIEHYIFTLPLDSRFSSKPIFKGRVPLPCIIDGR